MKVYLLYEHPTAGQVSEMMEALQNYIKLAVDIERNVVAGGGGMHADGEELLLKDGSRQDDIWGAD